jgi:nucleotide-binding universal stress UspA family protein
MARALVVGYDGSECANAALDAALELAQATGDRVLIGFGYGPGDPGEEYKAHREEIRKFGERATAPGLERARAAGVDVELALVPERPVEALMSLAAEHNARAIVVGSSGEGPIRGALLGSTPHKLLHLSEQPVLVVPVPEG